MSLAVRPPVEEAAPAPARGESVPIEADGVLSESVEISKSAGPAEGAKISLEAQALVEIPAEPDVPLDEDVRLPSIGRLRQKDRLSEQFSQTRDSDDTTFQVEDTADDRSLRVKALENLDAIEILQSGIAYKDLTPEHRDLLIRYSGWTGMSRAFMLPGGRYAAGWEDIAKRLEALVDKDDRDALARSAATSSQYLPAAVTQVMWEAAQTLGFKGGVFLDPAAGTGRALGLQPRDVSLRTQRIGLMADPFSQRVAQLLYPTSVISSDAFEQFTLPEQSVDLAMGSIPFGNKRLHDPVSAAVNLVAANVHGFYFVKSMQMLRPGGAQIFVVPRLFLDSDKPDAVLQRKWLAKHARLIDAVRLPADAFEENGAPKTPLDVIILQKRMHPLGFHAETRPGGYDLDENDFHAPEWTRVLSDSMQTHDGRPLSINAWYAMHPDKILGRLDILPGRYGDDEPTVTSIEGKDSLALLAEALSHLPENILPEPQELIDLPNQEQEIAAHGIGLGDFFETVDASGNPKLARVSEFVAGKPVIVPDDTLEGRNLEKALAMVRMADTVQDLLFAQSQEGFSDRTIEALRERLNTQYDAFRERFGYLNNRLTSRLFSSDSRWAQVMALEEDYRPAITKARAQAEGISPAPETAVKASILLQRTQWPLVKPTHADTAMDALRISMSMVGRLDWALMSDLLGEDFSLDRMRDDLADAILVDPYSGQWDLKEAVLCGDVRDKIEQIDRLLVEESTEMQSLQDTIADVAQPKWGSFDLENVRNKLQEIIPQRIPFNDIGILPGAPWVPPHIVLEFAESLTGVKLDPKTVSYSTAVSKWSFDVEMSKVANAGVVSSYASGRMPIHRMLDAIFNNRPVVVRDPKNDEASGRVIYVVNLEDTAMARANAQSIQQAWADWIGADPDRRTVLEDLYNDRMNRVVARKFDGSYLTFPGMSPLYTLRPHQKNFVARALMGGNILADHAVGAGKTFMTIAMLMEGRRMGLFHKPFVVVPDAIVGQWATAAVTLYPQARVLTGASGDFSGPADRNKFFARCAYSDYDLIVVSQNVFAMLPADPAMEAEFLRHELDEIREIKEELNRSQDISRRIKASSFKGYAARENAINRRIQTLLSEPPSGASINMGQIGVDYIVLDEAHNHKNKGINSTLTVAGMGNRAGSKRARDMFLKVRTVQNKYPDGEGGACYLTGTPISNTVAEMHGLMEVMIPNRLKRMGLLSFDAWARTFARIDTAFSFTLTGEFKEITSLSKFHNLPELSQLYQSFADVITNEGIALMLKDAGLEPMPVPKIKGGTPSIVLCGMTPQQKAIIGYEVGQDDESGTPEYNEGSILWMLDNLNASAVTKGSPNTLTLIGDLRKAGLDARAYLTAPGPSILNVNGRSITPISERLRQTVVLSQEGDVLAVAPDVTEVNPDVENLLNMGEDFTPGVPLEPLEDPLEDPQREGAEAKESDDPDANLLPKLDAAVQHMMEEYNAWRDDRGVQLVFLDFSTPTKQVVKPSAKAREIEALCRLVESVDAEDNPDPAQVQRAEEASEKLALYTAEEIQDLRMEAQGLGAQRWSAYREFRKMLIERGVPSGEIAFIHDYDTTQQCNLLFEELRKGSKRFLFGSTPKIGAGVDVQERIVALHHLDAPWRPSDMDQRNGRGLRQGSALLEKYGDAFRVGIYYYVTEGAFDAGLFQILERKQKFIEQIKSASAGQREIADPERQAFDAGAIKAIASGNELLRDRTQAESVLLRLNETLKGARREAGHVDHLIYVDQRNIELHEDRAPAMTRAGLLAAECIDQIQARKQALESEMALRKAAYEDALSAYRQEREARKQASEQAKKAKEPDPFAEAEPLPRPSKDAIEAMSNKGPYDYTLDGKPETSVRDLSAGAVADLLVRRLGKVDSWSVSMAGFKEASLGFVNGCEVTLRDKDNFARSYLFRVYPPGARTDPELQKAYVQFPFFERSLYGQQGRSMMFRSVIDSLIKMRNGPEINAKAIEGFQASVQALREAARRVNEVTIPAIKSQIEPMEKIVDLGTLGLRMGVKKWDRLSTKLHEAVEAASALTLAEGAALDKTQKRIVDRGAQAGRFLPQIEEIVQHAREWLSSADDVTARLRRQIAAEQEANLIKTPEVEVTEAAMHPPEDDGQLSLDDALNAGVESAPGVDPVDGASPDGLDLPDPMPVSAKPVEAGTDWTRDVQDIGF